ncbi:MAG: ATP-binding protein, partial [Lachnospiraceae bacterium]|nr:ATP-binding protein [Lachnospiraceae bacterium]
YALHATDVNISIKESERQVYIAIDNVSSEPLTFNASSITDRFVKGDESRNSDGFGLGLSIVKDLTRLMNGTFYIDYDEDKRIFQANIVLNLYYGI